MDPGERFYRRCSEEMPLRGWLLLLRRHMHNWHLKYGSLLSQPISEIAPN